jgi:beta-phosphoglucomutase-like phosphatase (HAD superfamily)
MAYQVTMRAGGCRGVVAMRHRARHTETMEPLARYLSAAEAGAELTALAAQLGATEFARVRNLDYVFSPYELYPLAPRVSPPLDRIVAFAVDMDGTSTTTEPLALHALEYMVRRITGRPERSQWAGLDEQLDYPHVIGNSNFRHAEFLLARYRADLNPAAFAQAFIEAVCWTLTCLPDESRRREVAEDVRRCGLADLLSDAEFRRLGNQDTPDDDSLVLRTRPLVQKYGRAFCPVNTSAEVAAALDVYYHRYHSILRALEQGQGDQLARELRGDVTRRLVEPMPGYDVFVPLVKGWLGPAVEHLFEPLWEHLRHRAEPEYRAADLDAARKRLPRLAEHFRRRPARLALVTASVAYEARICMQEVLRVMQRRVQDWPVPPDTRQRIVERLADGMSVFDAAVNASDACEPRLKPHRDLYSLALYRMGVSRADYPYCVGLEDTEPGIIALRAAGIGCAVALPNRDTHRQNYAAAADVIRGGLPELILLRNLLLRPSLP